MIPAPGSPSCSGCTKAKGYRLPVHKAFFDGRSDLDWFLSIRDYLRYRAGASWRPARHRGACLVADYRDAITLLTQAFHQTLPAQQVQEQPPKAIATGDTHVSVPESSSTVPKKRPVPVPTPTLKQQVQRQGRVNGAVAAVSSLTVRLHNA